MHDTTEKRSVSFAVAKDHLSALTSEINESGQSLVVTRHAKPWVEIRPLAYRSVPESPIVIHPMHPSILVPDLDKLFEGYDGSYQPQEDGFANPAGDEDL